MLYLVINSFLLYVDYSLLLYYTSVLVCAIYIIISNNNNNNYTYQGIALASSLIIVLEWSTLLSQCQHFALVSFRLGLKLGSLSLIAIERSMPKPLVHLLLWFYETQLPYI